MFKLRPFQEIGAKFLAERKYALLADYMGLGKTPQALFAAKYVNAKDVLIVCPSNVKPHWRNLGEEILDTRVHIVEGRKGELETGFNVINYELLATNEQGTYIARQLKKRLWDLVIVDEAHRVKSHKTQQSRIILGGLLKQTKRLWALTGTPVMNNPVELFPLLRACVPERIPGYTTFLPFIMRYCKGKETKWGIKATGAENTDELKKALDGFMLMRTLDDVKFEMPPVQYTAVYCKEKPFILSMLKQQRELYEANKIGEEFKFINEKLSIEKLTDAREFIEDALECEKKVVVFAHHRAVVQSLNKLFEKYNPVVYYGGMTEAQRFAALKKFQTDPSCRLFIGSLTASGVGLDGLQSVSHTCIFVELPWVPALIEQAIGRLNRIGQTKYVNTYFIVYEGGIDEQIVKELKRKEGNIKAVVNYDGMMHKLTKVRKEENVLQKNTVKGESKMENESYVFSVNGVPFLTLRGNGLEIKSPVLQNEPPKENRPEPVADLKKEVAESPSAAPKKRGRPPAEITQTTAPAAESSFIDLIDKTNAKVMQLQKEGKDVTRIVKQVKQWKLDYGVASIRDIKDKNTQDTILEGIVRLFRELDHPKPVKEDDSIL